MMAFFQPTASFYVLLWKNGEPGREHDRRSLERPKVMFPGLKEGVRTFSSGYKAGASEASPSTWREENVHLPSEKGAFTTKPQTVLPTQP